MASIIARPAARSAPAGRTVRFGTKVPKPPDCTLLSDVPLSTLPTFNDYAHGMGGWDVTPGTQSRTYEVTWKFDTTGLTQSQLDNLQGAQTGIDIQWELQSS